MNKDLVKLLVELANTWEIYAEYCVIKADKTLKNPKLYKQKWLRNDRFYQVPQSVN